MMLREDAPDANARGARTPGAGADAREPTLSDLGLCRGGAPVDRRAVAAAGWRVLSDEGRHADVLAHPDLPRLVLRATARADAFLDYAVMLGQRRRIRGTPRFEPHAPRVLDVAVDPDTTATLCLAERLREAWPSLWWLGAVEDALTGRRVRDPAKLRSVERRWPRLLPFVEDLRSWSGRHALDSCPGNVLVDHDGSPVVNDPLSGLASPGAVAEALRLLRDREPRGRRPTS